MKLTAEHVRKNGKRIHSSVVAEGEVTGHKHELATLDGVERYELDGVNYLLVINDNGVAIQHPEHGTETIPPGVYREGIDLEYDYSAQNIRRVAD